MSEQNQENIEVSFGVTGQSGEYYVEFADGVRLVRSDMVAQLGGEEVLKAQLPALKMVNFEDFLAAFNHVREKRMLNDIHKNFVNSHFSGFRGGF